MNNEDQPLHIKEEEGDTIEIWLTKEKTPAAYERKKYELIHRSGMTEQEAEEHIAHIPIILEVFYSVDQGLFGVESEAIDSSNIYNPYSGEEIPNDNLIQ